jgi:hypothetical protein
MLSVFMLYAIMHSAVKMVGIMVSIIMHSIVILIGVMLSIIMLIVLAPKNDLNVRQRSRKKKFIGFYSFLQFFFL